MMKKKVFALTLIAASVIAAGCSSDDDDDTDMETPDTTEPGDVDPDGTDPDGTDPDGTDPDGTDPDGTDPDVTEPMAAVLPAGADYEAPEGTTLTLAEIAANTESLSSLAAQVGNCEDLGAALADPAQRLTVFAPNNDAFAAQEVTDALAAGADVCDVIGGHVLADTVADSSVLTDNIGTTATTFAGTTVDIASGDDGILTVGGAPVVAGDNFATNGVAHVISSVILPMAEEEEDSEETDPEETDPSAPAAEGTALAAIQGDGSLSSFAALVESSGFSNSLADPANDNFIVFAPTNAAIDSSVTTAAAYIVSSVATPTTEAPAPGTYTGTGDEAQTFVVAGDEDNLTVNGEAAEFVTGATGGAVVKFGS